MLDHIITALDQIFMSVPQFFIGILMCFTLGLTFRFFVPGEFVSYTQSWPRFLYYMMFPALAIAIPRIAMTVKMLRGSIRSELSRDYVRTSQSRGSARRTILSRHVVRNAMIPVITFLAISMAEIMTGTIVVEQVFTVPGIGDYVVLLVTIMGDYNRGQSALLYESQEVDQGSGKRSLVGGFNALGSGGEVSTLGYAVSVDPGTEEVSCVYENPGYLYFAKVGTKWAQGLAKIFGLIKRAGDAS